MSEFNDQMVNISKAMEQIEIDVPKLEKGVAKAARRVRKNLQIIAKAAKEGRKVALELSKQGGEE